MILEGGGLQLSNIGGSKKNDSGRTALKSRGSSSALDSYLQRGSPPPLPLGVGV